MKPILHRQLALLSAGVASLVLAGCASNEPAKPEVKEVIVTKVKRVVVTPPDHLLKDCAITRPPLPAAYLKLSTKEKEAALMKFSGEQTLNLGKCNADKLGLREWKAKELSKED